MAACIQVFPSNMFFIMIHILSWVNAWGKPSVTHILLFLRPCLAKKSTILRAFKEGLLASPGADPSRR